MRCPPRLRGQFVVLPHETRGASRLAPRGPLLPGGTPLIPRHREYQDAREPGHRQGRDLRQSGGSQIFGVAGPVGRIRVPRTCCRRSRAAGHVRRAVPRSRRGARPGGGPGGAPAGPAPPAPRAEADAAARRSPASAMGAAGRRELRRPPHHAPASSTEPPARTGLARLQFAGQLHIRDRRRLDSAAAGLWRRHRRRCLRRSPGGSARVAPGRLGRGTESLSARSPWVVSSVVGSFVGVPVGCSVPSAVPSRPDRLPRSTVTPAGVRAAALALTPSGSLPSSRPNARRTMLTDRVVALAVVRAAVAIVRDRQARSRHRHQP